MLSSTLARTSAKAMFDAMYAHAPDGAVLPPSSVIAPEVIAQTHLSFLGQMNFPTEDWACGARASHAVVSSPVSPPSDVSRERAKIASSLPVVSELTPEDLAYSPESFDLDAEILNNELLGDTEACLPPLHESGE